MYGQCMWIGCEKDAQYETPLDFPRLFLCDEHFDRHKKLANKKQSKIIRVSHSSFSQRQRDRNLKKQYRNKLITSGLIE